MTGWFGFSLISEQVQHVGVLDGQGLVGNSALEGISLFVVDDKNITQGPVDQIKANIRAELALLAIVLNQPFEEHPGTEGIVETQVDKVRDKFPVTKPNIIAAISGAE